MKTNKLYDLASGAGIAVDRFNLPENSSVSVSLGDRLFIALDNDLCGKEERVCLAHELGHCKTSGFYNIYSPFDIREKHERRANGWAIKKLIPEYRLKAAVRRGLDTVYALAEYFDVTADFMQKAIDYYKETA